MFSEASPRLPLLPWQERGWNGVELVNAWDCWVRDIEIINPDSGVLLNYQAGPRPPARGRRWLLRRRTLRAGCARLVAGKAAELPAPAPCYKDGCDLRAHHSPAGQALAPQPCAGLPAVLQVSSSTITGIRIWFTKTRANNRKNAFGEPTNTDGHWGLVYCEQPWRGCMQHPQPAGPCCCRHRRCSVGRPATAAALRP